MTKYKSRFDSKVYFSSLRFWGDTPPAGDPPAPPAPPASPAPTPPADPLVFSTEQQAKVNALLAEERRKGEARINELSTGLEDLRNQTSTTEEMKTSLTEQINKLKTQETLSKEKIAKTEKEYQDKVNNLEQQVKRWETRHKSDTIRREIMDAASMEKAFNNRQVFNELRDMARLQQRTGEDGKPLDDYEVIIDFEDIDSEGKTQKLALSPLKTVQRMKELTEKYGNLFVDPSTGGTGLLGQKAPPKGKVDVKSIGSLEEYEALKAKDLIL